MHVHHLFIYMFIYDRLAIFQLLVSAKVTLRVQITHLAVKTTKLSRISTQTDKLRSMRICTSKCAQKLPIDLAQILLRAPSQSLIWPLVRKETPQCGTLPQVPGESNRNARKIEINTRIVSEFLPRTQCTR